MTSAIISVKSDPACSPMAATMDFHTANQNWLVGNEFSISNTTTNAAMNPPTERKASPPLMDCTAALSRAKYGWLDGNIKHVKPPTQ
eukprot:CAMPEP_0174365146 /NCGR_PEP_ID=MMETSP0811_2-20130205/76076_1 /TAXON_ID=73025 ORGANISM="Eutreptiella gymnastica-like, Strain CCMP1594" /NCGR_SAMPLE_ID=MMETSP0811_2 /ASSEMBLY_ACC=CAM_ASM_000667 /LENGTH=86 /DNA_ID=CAMNT_0015505529 /DNA_START=93 /DNA_END=353 /DNA_ORIENTATION=+